MTAASCCSACGPCRARAGAAVRPAGTPPAPGRRERRARWSTVNHGPGRAGPRKPRAGGSCRRLPAPQGLLGPARAHACAGAGSCARAGACACARALAPAQARANACASVSARAGSCARACARARAGSCARACARAGPAQGLGRVALPGREHGQYVAVYIGN